MNEPSVRQNPEQHGHPESVVVGIDASAPAREALDWAAAEAARRSVPLRIAHSWSLAPYQVPAKEQGDLAMGAREGAEALVKQGRERVLAQYGELQVDVEVLPEEPVQGLIHAAGRHSLLVVGTRGHNRFAATMLGSVSQRLVAHTPVLLHHAYCPVAVVPHT